MNAKILPNLIKGLISALFIVILLYIMKDKYGQIIEVLKKTDIAVFAAGFLVFMAALAIAAFRLRLIIEAHGDIGITYLDVLSLTVIGYFFNNFLPTSIGGDVVKAYYLARKTKTGTESIALIFIDRAIGLFTMIFMAFAALFLVKRDIIDERARHMLYAIAAASVLVVVFMANKNFARKFAFLLALVRPIEKKLVLVYEAAHKFKQHKGLLLKSLAVSVLSQFVYFASIGLTAMSIGLRIPVMDILLRMPIVSAMSLLPSINGLGVREGATVVLFGGLVGKANAFALTVLMLAVLFITSILGGVVYSLSPQFKMRIREGG